MRLTTRIKTLTIGAIALTLISAVTACSTQQTKKEPNKTTDTVSLAGGAQQNFTRNFNMFSPASKKAPGGYTFLYEPLVRVDQTDSNKVKPWLAKKFHYSDGGKTLTFKLRDDVTWSDGKPLTSEDVKYTLELPKKTEGLGTAPPPNLKKVTTPDKQTAVVHYTKPELHDLANYGWRSRPIVPAHIWKRHDAKKWTNPKPVGTGPFTLESFRSQRIKLKLRDDYWGGKFHGVKHVVIKAFGSETTGEQMLLKDKLTLGGLAWKNYKEDYVNKDPKYHHYWAYPNEFTHGLVFNMKKKPTNNVHIRRALYAALDSKSLLKLHDTGTKPANPTGLDGELWGDYMPQSLRDSRHKQDVQKAESELKKSGYEIDDGKLVKDGKSYPLSLKTNTDFLDWMAYAPGMKSQWKDVLGINVSVKKSRSDQLGEYRQNGKFQILDDFVVNSQDIWSALDNQLSSSYLKPLGTRANGNPGRYENPKVDTLLHNMAGTRNEKKLKKNASAIEKIVVDQVPYAPVLAGAAYIDINSTDWAGWPDRKNAKYVPHPIQGPDTTLTLKNLKPRT